jgi:hypothetical protein
MASFRRLAVWMCIGATAPLVGISRPTAQTATSPPLQLEAKIPLGDIQGRIDHLAVDLPRRRLFVAQLGSNAVGVVDINERKVLHVITGLKEPQGIGYVPSSDTLFVANAGDGSLLLFRGESYEAAGRIDLGNDADNIRVDTASNRVFVGYGNGALAAIDPATNGKIADVPLRAHPESFQLARSARRIYVNLPNAREIAVIDSFAGKQTGSWAIDNDSHFPMALDENAGRVLVAFRNPLGSACSLWGTAAPLRPSMHAAMPTISSSMRSASACTSAAETDTWMCSRRRGTYTAAQPIFRRYRVREPRCLFLKSTGFSSPLAPIPANRRPCGSSVQRLEGPHTGGVVT